MKMLPSVTQVIKPWVDFSAIAPDVLEAAADRGAGFIRFALQNSRNYGRRCLMIAPPMSRASKGGSPELRKWSPWKNI